MASYQPSYATTIALNAATSGTSMRSRLPLLIAGAVEAGDSVAAKLGAGCSRHAMASTRKVTAVRQLVSFWTELDSRSPAACKAQNKASSPSATSVECALSAGTRAATYSAAVTAA